MNLETKIGDWLLDVAKYVLTAILLTSVFSDMRSFWTYTGAGILIASLFLIGVYLIKAGKKKEQVAIANEKKQTMITDNRKEQTS